MGEFRSREAVMLQILREQAGKEPLEDRYYVGYLACIHDLLNVDIVEVDLNVD